MTTVMAAACIFGTVSAKDTKVNTNQEQIVDIKKGIQSLKKNVLSIADIKVFKFQGKEYTIDQTFEILGSEEMLAWAKSYKPQNKYELLVMSTVFANNDSIDKSADKLKTLEKQLGSMLSFVDKNRHQLSTEDQAVVDQALALVKKYAFCADNIKQIAEIINRTLDQYEIKN